jgi:hypothetical protein
MTFHTLAIVTCIAALLLGTGWLFAGRLMPKRWRIEPSVGALLAGLGMYEYRGRRADPAILVSVAVEILLLLGFGTLLLTPTVGPMQASLPAPRPGR